MTESRTERTDFLGLLALYNADGRVQGWGWPYRNQLQIDAALAALHDAPRDGVALLTAPAAPTLSGLATGGYLLASTEYEVVQTFVDEYGRETEASTADSVTTDAGIPDPTVVASLGATSESAGFAGGLFEVWYSWTDADSRETKASPVASISLPYLAAGLYNEVTATLPVTPASVGAAGANIYIRHRGGTTVLASMTTSDTQTEVVLTGTIANCSMPLPTVNTTGGTSAIEITGAAANGSETPSLTRFYVRKAGQTWTAADRRLKLAGVDEWDPDTVEYPLTFTGAAGEMAPGYPPSISQVKSIRPIDLTTEVTGVLPEENGGAGSGGLTADDLYPILGACVINGISVEAQSPTPDMTLYIGWGTALLDSGIYDFEGNAALVIPTADVTNPRIDIVVFDYTTHTVQGPTENEDLKGTPDPDPVAPALPGGSLLLGTIYVEANATAIDSADIKATSADRLKPLITEQTALFPTADNDVVDAETAHALNATFSDTEVEGALNALGTKLNSVLAILRDAGIIFVE